MSGLENSMFKDGTGGCGGCGGRGSWDPSESDGVSGGRTGCAGHGGDFSVIFVFYSNDLPCDVTE